MKTKIKNSLLVIFLCLTSLWAILFIWTHQPVNAIFTYALILFWVGLAIITGIFHFKQHSYKPYFTWAYLIIFLIAMISFFSLEPRNDRVWQDETDKIIQFQFKDGKVKLQNVRNFIWHSDKDYVTRWETRQYDLEKLDRIDLVVSHFMQGPIAHVFITFGFDDGEHLAFSLEVRQEKDEGFSTIGGFFRQYELALVVGDENDLIYTRSNIREEDVYIYPIQMNQTEIQMLFLEFLNKANRLNHTPVWYNTYISNCTTILFDLLEHAVGQIPRDYRVTLPGLIPNYLYDKKVLDNGITLDQWKEKAHINPKIEHVHDVHLLSSKAFSALLRE